MANTRHRPTLDEVTLPPALDALTPEQHLELRACTHPEDAARWLLAVESHLSAKQLCAVVNALGHDASVRDCRGYREAWQADGRPRARTAVHAPTEDTGDAEGDSGLGDTLAMLRRRVELGDSKGALEWAKVAKAMGLDMATPVDTDTGSFDASRLSDAELACYRALEIVACGGTHTEGSEGEWFVRLLRRVPAAARKMHPAHVKLPGGSPFPTRLDVPKER